MLAFTLLQLITAPKAENSMYVQQRDEYLESFCKMATRKVSVITIFGPVSNSTMKIDHFQLGSLKQFNDYITAFLLAKVGHTLWERSVGNQKENWGFQRAICLWEQRSVCLTTYITVLDGSGLSFEH